MTAITSESKLNLHEKCLQQRINNINRIDQRYAIKLLTNKKKQKKSFKFVREITNKVKLSKNNRIRKAIPDTTS